MCLDKGYFHLRPENTPRQERVPKEGSTGKSHWQLLSEKQVKSVDWSSAAGQNYSLQDINNPVPEQEELGKGEQPGPNAPWPAAEKMSQGWRPLVKWPKSCDKTLWKEVNTDLCNILEGIKGTTMKKLERMGDLIYAYDMKQFGVVESKWSTVSIPSKSRRQTEIDHLVKERRQLKKKWRKATEEEKEGINLLQGEI